MLKYFKASILNCSHSIGRSCEPSCYTVEIFCHDHPSTVPGKRTHDLSGRTARHKLLRAGNESTPATVKSYLDNAGKKEQVFPPTGEKGKRENRYACEKEPPPAPAPRQVTHAAICARPPCALYRQQENVGNDNL
ncbi:hypothetical protein EVAR_57998_1 [Eumeta japonica]|uniref:Uncharacterized protein n=1 Tax=Eumeta variegata TaxID=151549 RepID=A0A4C1YBH9_EUMVA|nr:hypothetical protein EVAR_57998_1 [Eumeta japonica]